MTRSTTAEGSEEFIFVNNTEAAPVDIIFKAMEILGTDMRILLFGIVNAGFLLLAFQKNCW